jgi:uncharacterized protein (DUF2147 family)
MIARIVFFAGLVFSGIGPPGQDLQMESGRILGEWMTAEGKARVLITMCDSLYCGKIIWLKEPLKNGNPVVDSKNADPKLRDTPILGLTFLRGFQYDGDGEYVGGKVYDPESGDTYKGRMRLIDANTLELRGYVFIPLFGRTETWTR